MMQHDQMAIHWNISIFVAMAMIIINDSHECNKDRYQIELNRTLGNGNNVP